MSKKVKKSFMPGGASFQASKKDFRSHRLFVCKDCKEPAYIHKENAHIWACFNCGILVDDLKHAGLFNEHFTLFR